MGNNGLRWYSLIKLAGHTSSTRDKRKNGVIIIKTIIPIEKENGVILNGKKERVPDGDTLC